MERNTCGCGDNWKYSIQITPKSMEEIKNKSEKKIEKGPRLNSMPGL